jgi:hypothetical protein
MARVALRSACAAALLLSALGLTDPQPVTAITRCALHVGDGGWLAASALRTANSTRVGARNSERCVARAARRDTPSLTRPRCVPQA